MIRTTTFIASALAATLAASPAFAGEIVLTLDNVRANAGDLYVGVQTEDQFLQNDGIAGEMVENPQDGTVTVTISDVPDGQYSFSVWHDIDGDGTFSMGANGMPADGWTMLGATELRGMPTWAGQSFALSGTANLEATMIYPEDAE